MENEVTFSWKNEVKHVHGKWGHNLMERWGHISWKNEVKNVNEHIILYYIILNYIILYYTIYTILYYYKLPEE